MCAFCCPIDCHRYILSTALGLFNKKIVGKNYGIFGKGAFPGVNVAAGPTSSADAAWVACVGSTS
jgi:hypothetical protein